MKHTKGKVRITGHTTFGTKHTLCEIQISENDNHGICTVNANNRSASEANANAELICEAFNVTNETGKSPRQLADENKELLEALIGLRRDFGEVLVEYDIEPSMAGYMDVSKEVILTATK